MGRIVYTWNTYIRVRRVRVGSPVHILVSVPASADQDLVQEETCDQTLRIRAADNAALERISARRLRRKPTRPGRTGSPGMVFAHPAAYAHQPATIPTPTPPPAPAPAPRAPTATTLLSADFGPATDLRTWTVVDSADVMPGPSIWKVQNGHLLPGQRRQGRCPGMYPTALVTGDPAWQRLSRQRGRLRHPNEESA